MNIVFWIIVIVCLILIWFCLSFIFGDIGNMFFKMFNDVKEEMKPDEEKNKEINDSEEEIN